MIQEQQVKIGYMSGVTRFYYPLQSLNRLLGTELTEEEMLAIRWHMGAFDYSVKGGSYDMNNAFAGSRLAAMLHIADMMATHLDERTNAHE